MGKRTLCRLSPRQTANAKPGHGRTARLFADGGNLFLQTTIGENDHVRRSWVFRYERDGRRREMGLGAFPAVRTLKEARDEAKRLRLLLADGIDPLDQRRTDGDARAVDAAKRKTFAEAATEYLAAHLADWRSTKHADQWKRSLTVDAAGLADLPISAIDTAHVLAVIKPIWTEKPETASRTRGRIEAVLSYAIAAQYRRREAGNPAQWQFLKDLLPKKSAAKDAKRRSAGKDGHYAALPYRDVPLFVAQLRNVNSLSARAAEFVILTAARVGEVTGATWNEFDFAERTWTIPAFRMKAGREHKVPLSGRAVQILHDLSRDGDRVFPVSGRSVWICVRSLHPEATAHGFRSSFMDWSHEQTSAAKTVIDMSLARTVGDRVEAAYRRGDLFEKRRRLMEQWAEYCFTKPAADATATVTPLRGRGHA